MDHVALAFIQSLNRMIEQVGLIVIPFEILLIIGLSRNIFQREIFVNLFCGGCIFSLFTLLDGYRTGWAIDYFTHYSLLVFDASDGWRLALWIIAHVLVGDLCFYIFHRIAHTKYFFMVDHVVHHSSTEFNFVTNLRVSFVSAFYSWTPLIIPVLLGFNPAMLFACFSLANAVPFFCHNQWVKKLGWVEYVFNTPSHHRVHHASNECYIDKNFGGMFIIWDRLFGTYADEQEPVKYGVRGSSPTGNPLKILFHGWLELLLIIWMKLLAISIFKACRATLESRLKQF
jgi:sterol desaturase/sphingolipid hydroxylase (fatty acid hydroxylase superfamily)